MEVQKWKKPLMTIISMKRSWNKLLLDKEMRNTLVRFVLTGGIATLLQYVILWSGVEVLGLPAAVASGIGYLVGSLVSYFLSYYYTFESSRSHVGAVSRFYIMVGIGWLINVLTVGVLADSLEWNKWLAQLIATAIALVWNFCFSRYWVFKSV
jgi:putative flippase GtrA